MGRAAGELCVVPDGLRFGLDDEPGIRRRGGRWVRYVDDHTGAAVTDADTLARIRALVIPPAWTHVWIAADSSSHVQATGRDARGRKQYRYHASFRESQEAAKFAQLVGFGSALPALRRRVGADLERRGLPSERVLALVVELLERTLVRVGNEEYARANGSYGLTTLRDRHVSFEGSRLRIRFAGKSSKVHDVNVADPRLARLVRRCQELPGQLLMQYVDDDGELHPVRSSDVNDYLRRATGLHVTAKTFRTWRASVLAGARLGAMEPPPTRRVGRAELATAMREVAALLNNTPAVCRRSYVHPAIVDGHLAGTLHAAWRHAGALGSPELVADERRLLRFLRAV